MKIASCSMAVSLTGYSPRGHEEAVHRRPYRETTLSMLFSLTHGRPVFANAKFCQHDLVAN
jgi:hypothetical protein